MVTGERLTLTLSGGAPWGFRLQGGGNFPLEVAKIRKNSHSQAAGLREGDIILSVNGRPMSGQSHQSAMDIVEMATNQIVFEVARPSGGQGASQPLDPQRHPRIIPTVSGLENAAPGIITSARGQYTSTEGNTRTDVQTNEYVMRTGDGRKVTKTVTEQKVTRYGGGSSTGLSPAVSQTSLTSGEHIGRSPARSPLMWQPPSTNRANIQKSQSTLDISFGHKKKSEIMDVGERRSLSPIPGSHTQITFTQKSSTLPRNLHKVSMENISKDNLRKTNANEGTASKENVDPIILKEQKKWEATHVQEPEFKLNDYGTSKYNLKKYEPPKMDDPKYPMFELPQTKWTPPKINLPPPSFETPAPKKWAPPVPPKPLSPAPSPIPFNPAEMPVAGTSSHHPGMIRPPEQPNLMPAPPPPPLPPKPSANPMFSVKKFQPGQTSTPSQEAYDEPDPSHRSDHLPVFQPRVVFAPDEDSGMMSPEGHDSISDDMLFHTHRKKLFSDSAFYDDSTNRYPTIDEQMSMCKKIAQSLTSVANKRARGARMFAKRKRKSNRWIHERPFGSEYSSSAGDVADLNDLDSELFYDEGGNKPLFTFRIPKVAGQLSSGQKMSLSKEEFERLRLAAPKVDHHGVSPNTCFNIAADLHKGGRNKGAKLFARRQQRVEKFVIDESNVLKSPISPTTKLDYIVQNPPQQKSPWNAAAQGDVSKAFAPSAPVTLQPLPKHKLEVHNQPKLLQGRNFNKKIQGWGGSSPGVQQQSYYRESYDPATGTTRKEWYQEQSSEDTFNLDASPKQLDQYGNYNRRIKAWPEPEKTETKVDYGDYNRKIRAWPEQEAPPPPKNIEFGDYNRRIKAWPESSQSTLPKRTVQQTSSFNVQTSYNSLPRGFGSSSQQHQHQQFQELGTCDL